MTTNGTYLTTSTWADLSPTHAPVDASRDRLLAGALRYWMLADNEVEAHLVDGEPDWDLVNEWQRAAVRLEMQAIDWVDTRRLLASWLQPWLDDGCECKPDRDTACRHCLAIGVLKGYMLDPHPRDDEYASWDSDPGYW